MIVNTATQRLRRQNLMCRGPHLKPVGERSAGNPHVALDERRPSSTVLGHPGAAPVFTSMLDDGQSQLSTSPVDGGPWNSRRWPRLLFQH